MQNCKKIAEREYQAYFRQDSGVISMDSSPDIIKDASDALKADRGQRNHRDAGVV